MNRLLPTLVLIAVLLGAVAFWLDFARHAVLLHGDQNTPPLMALHISQGRDFPVYFYGQRYMGGIDPYVIALMFMLLGPSDVALTLGMIFFVLLWLCATYLLFRRLVGVWAGVVAAAVAAFAPLGLIRETLVRTGYISTFAYGTMILYLGVQLNDRDGSSRAEWGCVLGMAALAGLSIWTNPLCAPYLIVGVVLLAAWLIRSRFRPALLAKLAVAFPVFLVTLSPAIVTGVRYGLGALFGFRSSRLSLVPKVAEIAVTRYIPDLLRVSPHASWPVLWTVALAYIVPLTVFVVGFVIGVARRDRRVVRAALVPCLFVLAFLPFYLPNPLAAIYSPRYFFVFWLLIAAAFAFPFVFRRPWLAWTTAACAMVVAVANVAAGVSAGRGEQGRLVAQSRATRLALIEATEAKGLRHVMHDTIEAHVLNWAGRERVVFASPTGERYYPYLAEAIADDNAGFCRPQYETHVFEETLRVVGITSSKQFSVGGSTIFHDLVLPTTELRLVEPVAASLVGAKGVAADASGLIDQDDETIVGDRYDADAALVVDLGAETPLVGLRFVAPYEWDYPAGYTISGSTDGTVWFELQHVERRLAGARIHGNRLFHRGRFGAMECRFPTTSVRFLKIHGMRTPAAHCAVWRFQEIYLYRGAGEQARPDEREAAAIAETLRASSVTFAFCDPWLSRKIELVPEPRPAVLPYYSDRHHETHVSRIVPIRKGVAVVVENGHAEEVRDLLLEATLGGATLETRRSPNYTAHVIQDAPDGYESFPGLRWNGFTLVRTARIATAAWYHEQGERLERAGRPDEAHTYSRRAFETYRGIPANLKKLAPSDDEAREALERLTPEVEARCRFPYGISLVGYTLHPSPLVPGETATLRLVWELDGEIPYGYLPVFVHFVGDEATHFQADHNVTFPLAPRTTVPRCLVLDEFVWNVPADCPAGELTIRLGALTWWDRDRRLRPRTKLPHRHRAVELGAVRVSAPAQ